MSIIAEIKNKYNTVSGGKLVNHYNEFNDLVNKKASKYSGATAYFVQIIPKKPEPFDKPFTPSDKSAGMKKTSDEKIREIDGRSFYAMVTGIDDSLDQLYESIPLVIKALKSEALKLGASKLGASKFTEDDVAEFLDFFNRAYSLD